MNDITQAHALIQTRIAAAARRARRNADEIQLIAVTKTFGPDVVADALAAGLTIFGENKVQEAAWKIPECPNRAQWQLIGHLQRNKARHAVELFSTIHSVDSDRLLNALAEAAQASGNRPEIYLEINTSGEPGKYGLPPQSAHTLAERAMSLPSLTLTGLMTMAPFTPTPEETRPCFARLRQLRDTLERDLGLPLPHLSMGMSGDFEIAIEEGATDIRIGTALFGHRPKFKPPRPDSAYDD